MLFSLLKHYLDTDPALKVPQSVYCFTTSISHGVENYFPRLWGTGISDAILYTLLTVLFPNLIIQSQPHVVYVMWKTIYFSYILSLYTSE